MRFSIITFFICFLLVSCKQTPEFDPALLHGEWRGADWVVAGKSSGRDAREVRFNFDVGIMTYTAAYGEQKETGTYRLEGKKLYTTAADKIEKVVKIAKISSDSLTLDMNRVGQNEQLILVKN
ncbi:MAG: hypothetical protein RIR11_3299 [Bacteroidota bacterium]|jgi:hypothetical protein